ncbi:hypothetical protein [Geothrix terrae]|uniref:hypothetical protein n=1 Tax=Geothrix terrae TaxID=2922720 RepID=UPI001FAD181D|nr:hypothetical protein [Geothrix terrae]
MPKPWQQALLSSGLPLENDLRGYLEEKGCIASFEYSYLKPDEHTIEREFSYDLDASYIKGLHFIDLMVECKYRYPGTKWIFTPGEYGGPGELYPNDFMHPFDHFIKGKFQFGGNFPRQLAPVCSKAVELLPDGANEKSIAQALHQLSYAFAPKLISAIDHQVNRWLVHDHIFYNVPIVATTAQLFRLRDGMRIQQIREAKELEEVASVESCLIMNYTPGAELHRYNINNFNSFLARSDQKKLLSSLHSFTTDLSHFFSVLANNYCPRAVVFVTVDEAQSGFEKLFQYIGELVNPSADLLAELADQQRNFEELLATFQKDRQKMSKKPGA